MNTEYGSRNLKKQEVGGGSSRDRNRERTFDATRILKNFGDFHFGSFAVNEIHLSKLHSKALNGYYEPIGVIRF